MADRPALVVAVALVVFGASVSVFCWVKVGGDGWGIGSWAIVATVSTLGLLFMTISRRLQRGAIVPMIGLLIVLAIALWVAATS